MMPQPVRPDEREGFALAAAVLAIVVVGAIVTGGFYAANQEHRISQSTSLGADAAYVAEQALYSVLAKRNSADAEAAQDIGDTLVFVDSVTGPGGATIGVGTVTLQRLNNRWFFAGSEGRLVNRGRDTLATRRIGTVIKIPIPPKPNRTNAIGVYGEITVGGNSRIDGTDATSCDTTGAVAGMTVLSDTLTTIGSNTDTIGDPAMQEDPSLNPDSVLMLGDLTFDDLVGMADASFINDGNSNITMKPNPSTNADGSCDTDNPLNWGDLAGGACGTHMPITYIKTNSSGSYSLQSGQGQGILLVDGNLRISGNFEFDGILLVRGNFSTSGTGNHVSGSVMVSGNSELGSISTSGDAEIQYSSCAIQEASNKLTKPEQAAFRSWVDLSSAGW